MAHLQRFLAQHKAFGTLARNRFAQVDQTEVNRRPQGQLAVVFQTAQFLRNRQSDTDGQTSARVRTKKTIVT